PVYTTTLTTDASAAGVITFTPEEGGSYRIIVSAADGSARSATFIWVSGRDYVSWRRSDSPRISLISDKVSYEPGETAEILIPSPFAGEQWAWVTVERGHLLRQEVIRLESNSAVYRLPITAEDAPNIFVSVLIVKGPDDADPLPDHRVGYIMLDVAPVQQELEVSITPPVPQAGPGDTVSFEVETRDSSGKPVSAALSLDVVDKAILTLMPRPEEGILEAFYGQRDLGVRTYSGLVILVNRLMKEQLQELEDQIFVLGLGGGGGGPVRWVGDGGLMTEAAMAPPSEKEGAEESPGKETVRERFADTAFWDAHIVTDETGRATVEVSLPDNLTTWVVRGVAATAQTQVGEGTVDFLVTKPLLVRPVAPRFFVVGDRVRLAALVSNNTGAEQDVAVALRATGLLLADPATQRVTVPDGGETQVTWWVTATDVPTVSLVFSAQAGEYGDAARPRLTTGPDGTLIVRRYSAPEVVGTGGQLVGEDSRTEVIALPPRYDGRQGTLSIRLDPSLAAGMTSALDYLEGFPYECIEQTVSRFLPNVVTYRALKQLGLSNPELEEKLPDLIADSLDRLYTHQNPDGGWGWWPDEDSNPYLTAYVLLGLVEAQEAGFAVRAAVIGQAENYLIEQLLPADDLDSYWKANRQAFILYALAEAGRNRLTSETGELFRRRDKLSLYGRALLAMTLSMTDPDDSRIATLLSDFQNEAILSATGAHWEEADYDWWAMNTDTRSTAIILDALARLDPDNALIPNAIRWLMVARQEGIWETTQENVWAILAFTDWMVVTGELRGEYEYEVGLNDALLTAGAVTPDNVAEPIELQVAVSDLLANVGNYLTIGRGPGPGRLYYTAHLRVYLPAAEVEPLNRGIIVTRQYYRPGETDAPLDGPLQVGDEVEVHLTLIAPHDLYYVVVEDPLPAGGEAINPELATTSLLEQGGVLTGGGGAKRWPVFYRWWWQWYSRSEMRDDRVVLFADYLPAGTYEYVYTFRATQPGEYNVIPTTAQEMYFPEVFGRGAGQSLVINP
ncbi:MAG TPA: alpha-2-macroglobulin, partial [Anaerolineae bacterium]|nr:alpha-2-macroglobulin [Anaerolineae bacterium]